MNISDLLPEDQKLLSRIRCFYPRKAGFLECLEAFQNALDGGISATKLVNAVQDYYFYVRVHCKRDWEHSPYVMSAKSFMDRKKWEESWAEKAYCLLGDKKVDMRTPQEEAELEAINKGIQAREKKIVAELNRKAAEADEVYPRAIVEALAGRKAMNGN